RRRCVGTCMSIRSLVRMLAAAEVVAVVVFAWGAAFAQDAAAGAGITQPKMMAKDADPDWDVVTVRPSDPNARNDTFGVLGRHVILGNRTVETILRLAYGVQKSQIDGLPDWGTTEHFDAE